MRGRVRFNVLSLASIEKYSLSVLLYTSCNFSSAPGEWVHTADREQVFILPIFLGKGGKVP